MNKVIKLGMIFNEDMAPDFGNIQQNPSDPNILYLIAEDIPKLNSMLTRTAAASYLPKGQSFNFCTGALAFVLDHKTAGSGKIYAYHRGKDYWYEFNIRSDLELVELMWHRHARIVRETTKISGTPPLIFESNGRPLKNYRIYGNTVNGESVGDSVTDGEHSGEYCVPIALNNITTNIYLPEPLKKVGDAADYLDFSEQKMCIVTKNLAKWNSHIMVSSNNKYEINNKVISSIIDISEISTLYLFGDISLLNNNIYRIGLSMNYPTVGNTASRTTSNGGVLDVSGYNYAVISCSIYNTATTFNQIKQSFMITKGSIPPETFEEYTEDINLSVTLPKIPTIQGTNNLDVNTAMNLCKVEIEGNRQIILR